MRTFTLLKSNKRLTKFFALLFNQLHILLIIVALLLFGVENAGAQCTPTGDQTSYGAGSWIGYVYSNIDGNNPPTSAFVTYAGYVTQPEMFDQNLGSGAISGANVCGSYTDRMAFRFKMQKTFVAGYYTFTIGGDDGVRLSLDGGTTFAISDWNYHAYQTTSATYYLSGPVNLVYENYDQGGESRVSFSYTSCTNYSTAPTSISGTTNICNGTSTTLTATGGTAATGCTYQWGTGSTVGSNVIAGQTSASTTVNPTTNTTYWVRRLDPSPCNTITSGVTQAVTVTTASTAPTSITGTTTLCLGSNTVLTATGGTLATGSTYEWGTGTVGSNIILGQSGASITVTPTSTTTYWVRRTNVSPCTPSTGAATISVSVNVPAGDQTSYGSNSWIGYVYSDVDSANPPTNVFTTNYRGYVTQTETFDQSLGSGSISGPNLCGSYSDRFSIRFKMQKNFTTGYYTFSVGGDDGYRLSFDGGATFPVTNFTDHGYVSSTSIQYYLSGNVNLVLEYYEQGGDSRVSFSYTACTNFSTAPTGISGTSSLCNGTGGTTLAATGGYEAPGATYQWGTGSTVGSNIIGGANSSTYYINPSSTTIYWVRRVDGAPCNLTTGGTVQTITVSSPSTNPTSIAATASTICSGTSITLTANGGTLATGGSYQWGTGYSAGSNIIAGQTTATLTITPLATSGYWVRRVDPAPCNTATPGVNTTINVSAPSMAPTSISSVTTSCSGTSVQLTAVGGTLGTSGSYQWGTGTTIGSNIIAGNSVSNYVNPTATTTYWVRIVDGSPCNSNTAGVTQTVTVSTASTAPGSITASATNICNGTFVTLTANGGTAGTGYTYQWGTGYTVGSNIISGTGISISVNPIASTVYWVRRIDPAPCSTQTGGPTVAITVTSPSTAPTSITGGGTFSCAGSNYTLTATGGTAASGSTYQWGTGSVIGSNVISGTGASITVTPAATTTYWVRRYDGSPCSTYTSGVTTTITISGPPGNPATFGGNVWNVYGYNNPDITLATAVYAGYYSVNTLGVDTQNGTNSWNLNESPSSSAGWSGCSVPYDNFTMTLKRQGFPCGIYNLVISNWDDVAQVYIDGTQVWSCAGWYGGGGCNGNLGSYTLGATSTIEIRIRENSGGAGVALALTKTNVDSTAPTSISGTTTTCSGSAVTLTASGGTLATTGSYQWGTGSTVGSNIILGEIAASITVFPTATTTYWVRRYDSLCGATTSGITQTVTATTGTTAGTLSTPNATICRNNSPNAITLSGNVGNVIKWQFASDAAFTSGVGDITSTATVLTSADMGSLINTRYYRAVVQYGSCPVKYTSAMEILVPAAITYNGTWSATPTASSSVIIMSNLTLTSNLNVCSCQVNSGVTLTVNSGSNLIVQTSVTVDPTANVIVRDKGSLVQVDDTSTNIGKVTVYRNTARMKLYDYTYWSSPVQNWRLSDLSPNTLSDKYFSFNPLINNWVGIPSGNAIMTPAKGYIVRAPQGWSATNASLGVYEGIFTGAPNTGVVPVTIQKGTGSLNLIGNPYPSAIDIDLFLTDPANSGIVNGTIYLWTHNTAISTTIAGNNTYNYTADDYAKYNLTGGVRTASPAITGGAIPDGKVASGQAFFIEAATGLANGTYTANFKNNMRVAGSNGAFFRVTPTVPNSTTVEKNRIWLNISNTQGGYNEILVGYVTGATNSFDNLFDGKVIAAGNVLSLYSIDAEDNYSIQGRALPFSDTDMVPLGYKTTVAGDFTISLGSFDGLFQSQDVYLIDKLTNTTQNLKNGAYTFTTDIGTFNERFEIHYTATPLAVSNPENDANGVVIYTKGKQVNINSARSITAVTVYDLLGRVIYTEGQINARAFKTPALNASNQVLIVKVMLDNHTEATKKIVLN